MEKNRIMRNVCIFINYSGEMGQTCFTHKTDKKLYHNFRRRLGRMDDPKGKWADDAEDVECEAGWIYLFQD
jgi:hypothetical protein